MALWLYFLVSVFRMGTASALRDSKEAVEALESPTSSTALASSADVVAADLEGPAFESIGLGAHRDRTTATDMPVCADLEPLNCDDCGKDTAGACTRAPDVSSAHALGSTCPEGLRRSWSHQSQTTPAEDKTSMIAQLQPLLQPSLHQDGLTWDEAAPVIAKLHIDFLRKAVATANVQPVLVKLKAAAYKNPAFKKLRSSESLLQKMLLTELQPALRPRLEQMGLLWEDALLELKQMPIAVLECCLVSGCVTPITEQLTSYELLTRSRSAAEQQRAKVRRIQQDERASVFAQLRPLLSPSLRQDGLTWDEAAPLLAKLHIDFLRKAVATANVQPVIAKLKAAAYQKPAMRKLAPPSEHLQSLLLTRLQPVSAAKKLSSCPEALFERVVSNDDLISTSGAQNKLRCCDAADKKKAEEAGKNHLRDLALQLQEEEAKNWEIEAARACEEEAAKQKEEEAAVARNSFDDGSSKDSFSDLTSDPQLRTNPPTGDASDDGLISASDDVSDDDLIDPSAVLNILYSYGFNSWSIEGVLAHPQSDKRHPPAVHICGSPQAVKI